MKVYELAKELGITPKELISFLRENGYKVSSGLYTQYACLLNVPCEKFEIKR